MYKTTGEAVALVRALVPLVRQVTHCRIAVAPPFTALSAVSQVISGTNIALAGQNCHWEQEGAYTGEISPRMLVDLGCRYVIIGHSERRQHFMESDQLINRKLRAALASGLNPILCVGETLSEREAGQTERVIERQMTRGLDGLTADEASRIIIAYEPVWAIGTGRTATPDMASQAHTFIRRLLSREYGDRLAREQAIIYGGSVKPDNISGLMAKEDIDGALVGGASLEAESFAKIVKYK